MGRFVSCAGTWTVVQSTVNLEGLVKNKSHFPYPAIICLLGERGGLQSG